jgi:hypothetical protein
VPIRVLADANVLFSRTLRDWLLLSQTVSDSELFAVYWTEDILAETVYRLRRGFPDWDGGKITTIRDKIAQVLEGGRVDDFPVDASFPGTDANDRHVHGAALACRADILLTEDAGFGKIESVLPYEVYGADDFFVLLDDSSPETVRVVTERQAHHFWRTRGEADLCTPLKLAGCPEFAERVRAHLQQLDTSEW